MGLNSPYRVYVLKRGQHPGNERVRVTVALVDGSRIIEERELTPSKSQQIINHSPDGFEWGYGGSGPAQLALAILLDYTKSENKAVGLTQDFKCCFIAGAKKEGFQINESEIQEFLERYSK